MKKPIVIFIALSGWFAIIAQFILMCQNRTTDVPEMIFRFFSFFTILTNILVALWFTKLALRKETAGEYWSQSSLTATTAYITVVGLVYQIALRHIWNPTGLQRIVDELLHTIIPLAVIFFWLAFADKVSVSWKKIPKYLIYPLGYLGFIIARGGISGFYPYPFIEVDTIGWNVAVRNILILFAVFIGIYLIFMGIAKVFLLKLRIRR